VENKSGIYVYNQSAHPLKKIVGILIVVPAIVPPANA
jgi:ABC-type sulfate transport system permease component